MLASSAHAATITVGQTGADHTTIAAALAVAVANDVVQIIDDAVYDEAISITVPLTLEGTGLNRPVIAARPGPTQVTGDTGGTDGLVVQLTTPGNVTLRNLIIIPSKTTTPTDDLVRSGGTNAINLLMEDVVVTSNNGADAPVTTTGLTEVDLTGATQTGDDGVFLTGTNSTFTLRRTVISHHANAGAGRDGLVCSGATNQYFIEEGCVFSYMGRLGIQANGGTFDINSGAGTRVRVIGNKGFAGIWYAGAQATTPRAINGCDIVHNVGTVAAQGWGVENQSRGTTTGTFSNMRIWGNGGQGFLIGSVGTADTVLNNVTIGGNQRAALEVAAAVSPAVNAGNITINDSILAGNGDLLSATNVIRHNGAGTMTINNSAIITEGRLAFATPVIDGTGTVVQNNVINGDPEFTSGSFTNAAFLEVRNPAYVGAGSGASDLVGGGSLGAAEPVYVWDVAGSGDFQAPASWSPARNTPAITDRLVFDGIATAGAITATNLPGGASTQEIGRLILRNGADVTITTATEGALAQPNLRPNEDGTVGYGMSISADSKLTFGGTVGVMIRTGYPTGPTVPSVKARVDGSIRFTSSAAMAGVAHRLVASSIDGIVFEDGSSFEFAARGGSWGFPFSSVGRVRFNNGSAFYQGGTAAAVSEGTGSNPFNNNDARMFCEPDSLFYNWTSVISTSGAAFGRSYGNLTLDNRGAAATWGGASPWEIQGDLLFKSTMAAAYQFAAAGSTGDPQLTVGGDWTIENGGRYNDLYTGASNSILIAGNVDWAGTLINIAAGSTRIYGFNGTAPQTVSIPATVTLNGISVDNAAGVTITGDLNVRNVVNMINGDITGNLILGATAVVNRSLNAAVTGARTLPIGSTPVTFNITSAGTGTGTVSGSTTASAGASLPALTTGINRTWDLTATGISGYTATLTFTYLDGDLGAANEASLRAARFNGSTWDVFPSSTVDTGTNTVTVTGVTELSTWTLVDQSANVREWSILNH
ncbi:MAG: hypothetical protein KF858_07795 [Candidatus Sumerlaeia bacterium]|nr:hypothetical protein [Candidatus Sumerlaeia bacterium]